METKITNYDFYEIINSLDNNAKNMVKKLHKYVISLDYKSKISTMGKKPNDWKCEYIKNKNVLCILRIKNNQWSIRCKLFNLPKYNCVLEECNEHFIETLLKNSKNCGNHGGACKGPIEFSIEGKKHSKCRHFFMLTELIDKDIDDLIKLFERESCQPPA